MPATTDHGPSPHPDAAAAAASPGAAAVRRRSGSPGPPVALRLLMAAHPVPAAAVTLLAALLAAAAGLGPVPAATAVAAVAAGQLSIGWCNDRADLRRDRAARRFDKPLVAGELRPWAVSAAACASLLACVPLSLACGPRAGAVHLGCVGAAWAYNLWLKRTVASWLPYAVAFALLPAFLALTARGGWPPAWLTAAAGLMGTSAHFANTLPDIDADLAGGVRGLPQRLGRRPALVLSAAFACASCALLTVGPPGPVPAARWLLLGTALGLGALAVAAPPALARGRTPFLVVLLLSALAAGLLVLAGRGPAG